MRQNIHDTQTEASSQNRSNIALKVTMNNLNKAYNYNITADQIVNHQTQLAQIHLPKKLPVLIQNNNLSVSSQPKLSLCLHQEYFPPVKLVSSLTEF